MEKFSQFRDRGSGVSPFIPVTTPSTVWSTLPRTLIFLLRVVPFIAYAAVYFLVLHFLPLPAAVRKLLLWAMMAIPGIWWVDLQIDGVKRGHLSQQPPSRVPQPGSVIAASFTSPVDALYLSAIFDPIFTISYPNLRKVRRVSLFSAITQALSRSQLGLAPTVAVPDKGMTDLRTLLAANPDRIIVVFPECGTTNGKGVLPLSPSLLSVPPTAKIFPISMRYTPADITTPIPGAWSTFLWELLSRPTHYIRVRIAEGVSNTAKKEDSSSLGFASGAQQGLVGASARETGITPDEQSVLDRVADSLARLGRNKRVGLTIKDKKAFVDAWNRPSRST